MVDKITKIRIEGFRPTGSERAIGVAIKSFEDMTPEHWLMHLRMALDALYRHELRKVMDLDLDANTIEEGEPFNK